MNNSILDMLGGQLGGNTVNEISQQIGADPGSTQNAIQMALPMLLGGLAHNASQPEGAMALNSALDQHDPSLLDNLGSMLGGGGGAGTAMGAGALGGLGGLGGLAGGLAGGGGGLGGLLGGLLGGGAGAGILGHVLGGRQAGVERGVARASGLNQQQVGKLLLILAPLVMAALARRRQQAQAAGVPAGPAATAEVLNQERQHVEQRAPGMGGLLGKIFNAASRPARGSQQGTPVAGGIDLDGDGIADEIGQVNPGMLGGLFGRR